MSTHPVITSLNLIFNLFLDFSGKLLRIVRTFTDESGNVCRNEQVVRDPDVISAYLRVKNSKVILFQDRSFLMLIETLVYFHTCV